MLNRFLLAQNEEPLWDDLRVLLALHRARSFLGAGRALGLSTSTAARRVQSLEASLGRALVHRTSAGTLVEPDAMPLIALAEQLELGLRALRREETKDEINGTVRLSMGEGMVRPITQALCELRTRYPDLLLEILAEARQVDLARREADLGLRFGRSSSPVLVERLLGQVPFSLWASTAYIGRRLRLARLERADFARHDFIGYEGPGARTSPAKWLEAQGAKRFVVRSNSDQGVLEAMLQGQGIALLADPMARGRPGCVRLEVDAAPPSVALYLAFHRELRRVPRVKVVADALAAAVRDGLTTST